MIPFTKAHACGNDFLIIKAEALSQEHWPRLTRLLCQRNTGVGADGIEFFQWTGPRSGRIRLVNSDGSVAEISGNGTRCVAAWMAEKLDARAGDTLHIDTDAGMRICHIDAATASGTYAVEVTTGMGVPTFAQRTVTFSNYSQLQGAEVSTGNPHFVIAVENSDFSIAGRHWQEIGDEICHHPDFPQQTNVEFIRILSPHEIEIRIFERGVGPTSSSGTGTSASATAAIGFHNCVTPLRVLSPGGAQSVAWNGAGTELHLTGPASLIAHGEAWFA